jgi:hypothetical protein
LSTKIFRAWISHDFSLALPRSGWKECGGLAGSSQLFFTFDRLPPSTAMAKKDPQVERIGDVLEKSLKRFAPAMRLDEYGVWPVWNDVVGKAIAQNAQPEKIRNGTLFIKVASPVWMQQLQYMKDMIAEKLNARLAANVVKNIFFVVGRVSTDGLEEELKSPAPKHGESSAPLIDEAFLESIRDPEIRQAFKRLLKSYARRKQSS